MQLGELGAECGLEGFGVFVDYAVVAIVEFCVMENLAVVLLFSALLLRGGGRDEHGTHLRTILHKVRDRRVSPALQILLPHLSAPTLRFFLLLLPTNLNGIQRLRVLDEFIVVCKLSLRQQVVERLGNVAVAGADRMLALKRERKGGETELGVFLVEQRV